MKTVYENVVFIEHKIINCAIELKKIFIDEGVKIENIQSLVFKACDIKDIDFNFLPLKYLTFVECDIYRCEWLHMNMSRLSITRSSFWYCTFHKCNFTNIVIETSKIVKTPFTKCSFDTFDIDCSKISNSVLHKVRTRKLYGNSIEPFKLACLSETSGFESLPMKCPRKGEFIGWKKCYYDIDIRRNAKFFECIVKLLVPSDAKRSSGVGNKCRCSKAKVLGIYDIDHELLPSSIEALSSHNLDFIYRVGEWVYPDSFDDDRFIECSNGIHFFMSFEEAAEY